MWCICSCNLRLVIRFGLHHPTADISGNSKHFCMEPRNPGLHLPATVHNDGSETEFLSVELFGHTSDKGEGSPIYFPIIWLRTLISPSKWWKPKQEEHPSPFIKTAWICFSSIYSLVLFVRLYQESRHVLLVSLTMSLLARIRNQNIMMQIRKAVLFAKHLKFLMKQYHQLFATGVIA